MAEQSVRMDYYVQQLESQPEKEKKRKVIPQNPPKAPKTPAKPKEAPVPEITAPAPEIAAMPVGATPEGSSEVKPASMQVVTPWEVDAGDGIVDYDALIQNFGSKPITHELLERIERATGRPCHHWLKSGLFFSHRDLELILNEYEQGKQFFIYTGRGPSSEALHLGHLIPFMFTRYLQDLFHAPVVIQLTDDEKFLWKDISLEDTHRLSYENSKDIIACGFDPERTFIFSDYEYIGSLYPNICKIEKKVTVNQVNAIFGFDGGSNIGKIDPYFRMARDVAPRLEERKPALIHSKFFPALTGAGSKMSASADKTSIFVTDTPQQIKKKINRYAFSGGGETIEEHKKNGANLSVDIPYQYLRVFCDDEALVESVGTRYGKGEMTTGEVKEILIGVLQTLVRNHQEKRTKVTNEVVKQYMQVRPLKLCSAEDRLPAK